MRKLAFRGLILFFLLFFSSPAGAQMGWQWGRTNYQIGSGSPPGFEIYATTIDWSGNLITGCYAFGDSIKLGSLNIYNTNGILIVKTDASGNYLWAVAGQSYFSTPVDIKTDEAGNVYVLGKYYTPTLSFGSITLVNSSTTSQNQIFLLKISSSGSILWAKNIAPSSGDAGMGALAIDDHHNIYITENFDESSVTIGSTTLFNSGYEKWYIAKFDPDCNAIWAKGYSNSVGENYTSSMALSKDGCLYISGLYPRDSSITIGSTTLSDSGTFLAKFDTAGNSIWAKNMRKYDYGNGADIAIDGVGSIYVCGPSYLIKYNSMGSFLWERNFYLALFGGITTYSLGLDMCGRIWLCGAIGGHGDSTYTIKFGGHTLTTPAGSYDAMFVAEYDTSGNYQNSIALPSGGDDISSMEVDNRGNFYVTGDYWYTQMIFSGDTLPVPSSGSEYLFIAKYTYDTMLCPVANEVRQQPVILNAGDVVLYPNPANEDITIATGMGYVGGVAEVYDLSGRRMLAVALSGNSTKVKMGDVNPGVYLCRITSTDGTSTVKKLVVAK